MCRPAARRGRLRVRQAAPHAAHGFHVFTSRPPPPQAHLRGTSTRSRRARAPGTSTCAGTSPAPWRAAAEGKVRGAGVVLAAAVGCGASSSSGPRAGRSCGVPAQQRRGWPGHAQQQRRQPQQHLCRARATVAAAGSAAQRAHALQRARRLRRAPRRPLQPTPPLPRPTRHHSCPPGVAAAAAWPRCRRGCLGLDQGPGGAKTGQGEASQVQGWFLRLQGKAGSEPTAPAPAPAPIQRPLLPGGAPSAARTHCTSIAGCLRLSWASIQPVTGC